ncbi:MAG: hypothetical protein ACE5Z5_10230 [Candidatus Bathyarchaeia archaeon]
MSAVIKKNIPLAITFIIGVLLIFEWFIPTPIGDAAGSSAREWGIIINSFAIMVGVVGLYGRELRNLSKKAEDWPFSVWMLIVTTLFIVVGVTFGYQDERYQWIYNSVLLPLSATMYGSISF